MAAPLPLTSAPAVVRVPVRLGVALDPARTAGVALVLAPGRRV